MVSKKSLSMRLKIHRTAAVTPSLAKAPMSNAPTRLKSGVAEDLAGDHGRARQEADVLP